MLGLLTSNRTSPIAIDFGACSLRAAQLVERKDGWHIYHWFNVEMDAISVDPPPLDYATHLKMALGPGSFKGRQAAIALAAPDLEYRLLDMPSALLKKKPSDLRDALEFEMDRQLPWPAKETEMAAWPVGPSNGTATCTMVAAARTASIESYLKLLEAEDLECVLADVTPHALARLHTCEPGHTPGDNVVWGALDIGFRACRLYLMHADRPVFARVLRGGGRDLTEVLAKGLHVEFGIAEQYKRLYGIQPSDRGVRAMAGGGLGQISEEALPGMFYAILARSVDTLVADIERSYRFVLDRTPSAVTGKLYLLGGGSRLKGLPDVLELMLGLSVCPFDPADALCNAQTPDGPHPACTPIQYPALAACIGLAMQECTP
jgi:type IV pilus assembly protein PilM